MLTHVREISYKYTQSKYGAQAFARHLLEHEVEDFTFSALPGAGFKFELLPSLIHGQLVATAIVPGLDGTLNDGAGFPFRLTFADDYPARMPSVRATYANKWHVCMYLDGTMYSRWRSSLWHEAVSIKELLLHIQLFMHTHNVKDPSCSDPHEMWIKDPGRFACCLLDVL